MHPNQMGMMGMGGYPMRMGMDAGMYGTATNPTVGMSGTHMGMGMYGTHMNPAMGMGPMGMGMTGIGMHPGGLSGMNMGMMGMHPGMMQNMGMMATAPPTFNGTDFGISPQYGHGGRPGNPTQVEVRVISATGLKGGGFELKADPYVKIVCGHRSVKTSTKHDGGKNPMWNEVRTLKVTKGAPLRFIVFDDDTFKDDELGSCLVPYEQWAAGFEAALPLVAPKGKIGGSLKVAVRPI